MFVFYFGIMADITPPVGLATFAAAAISGEDPLKTGIMGVIYAMRTVILPFIFIFNPLILLIGIGSVWELILVVFGATLASLTFAAATMFWFRIKCNWLEVILLLLATFLLFRPDWFMNKLADEYVSRPVSELYTVAADLPESTRFVAVLQGFSIEGDEIVKTVAVNLPALAEDDDLSNKELAGRKRLNGAGLNFMVLGDQVQLASVRFGSNAQKSGWDAGWDVLELKVPNPARPSELWFFVPALIIILLVWLAQGRRMKRLPGHTDRVRVTMA